MLAPVRSPDEVQRELEEARAAPQRAEQALFEDQARVGILQAALAQCD